MKWKCNDFITDLHYNYFGLLILAMFSSVLTWKLLMLGLLIKTFLWQYQKYIMHLILSICKIWPSLCLFWFVGLFRQLVHISATLCSRNEYQCLVSCFWSSCEMLYDLCSDEGWKSKLKLPPKDRRKQTSVCYGILLLIFCCLLLFQFKLCVLDSPPDIMPKPMKKG